MQFDLQPINGLSLFKLVISEIFHILLTQIKLKVGNHPFKKWRRDVAPVSINCPTNYDIIKF